MGFPGDTVGKESTCNSEDTGLVPGSNSPGGGHGSPFQYLCLENPMVVYSPEGRKESDTIEATEHTHTGLIICKKKKKHIFKKLNT